MKKQRCFLAALVAFSVLFSLTGCGDKAEKQGRTYYLWFDTVTEVTGYDTPERFEAACSVVESILEEYHRAADIYHEYSGCVNACSLNRLAGTGPVAANEKLLELCDYGKEMYSITDGFCNIAFGSVLSLWHDAREAAVDGQGSPPDESSLKEASVHCDIGQLVVNWPDGTVELKDSNMSLDFGAIAKGFAAERAAEALEEAGFSGYALSVGGNVRTVGPKGDGSDWVAGIQNPDTESSTAYLVKVPLRDMSLVTSGSYQRYFECDGVRYHHIIHPDTLQPENELLSVTIYTKDSGIADALSTAVFNMGLQRGREFIENFYETEACWITAGNKIVYSSGFPK